MKSVTATVRSVSPCSRRGTALVAMLVLLSLMGLVAVATMHSGARDQIASLDRMQGGRAQYAAEAAANLAVKEFMDGVDLDGDGGIGTISDDSNTATDPTINNGTRLWATKAVSGNTTTITARGQNADAARAMQVALTSTSGGGGPAVYWSRSGTSVPYSSAWSGSAWGAATALPTFTATGQWLQAASHPTGSEIALGATGSGGAIEVMLNTSGTFAAPITLVANSGSTAVRKFTVAYEQTSGECMAAYSTGTAKTVDYRTSAAGVFGSAATAITTTANAMDCVRLVTKSNSDELMLLAVDSSQDLFARVWTGSSWVSTSTTLSTTVQSSFEESFAGVYESSSGQGLVVYANASDSTPNFRTYVAGSWSGVSNMTACSGYPNFIHMAAKPGSDEVVCGIMDANKHIRVYVWDGSSWVSSLEVTTNTGYNDRHLFDVAYSPDGTKAMVVYGDDTNSPQYRTYSGGNWSAATSMTSMGNKPGWVQIVPGASGGEMYVAIADQGHDLNLWRWSGSAMGTMTRVESSLGGSNTTEQFWMVHSAGVGTPEITSWTQVAP